MRKKLTAEAIMKVIRDSRPGWDSDGYETSENWTDLETIGITDKVYLAALGNFKVVDQQEINDWSGVLKVTWYFLDHDVYIQCVVDDGSYGVGYKLEIWELKQVFPRKVEVTVYE